MHRGSEWPWCLLISGPCGRTGHEDHESFQVSSSSSGISFLLASQELPSLPLGLGVVGNPTLLTYSWYASIQAPYPSESLQSFTSCQFVQESRVLFSSFHGTNPVFDSIPKLLGTLCWIWK